ncbi:hypothetical protein SteCoe_15186 [Stentor coeruleus]|uniref:G-protein coupled receptors family 2 profile 2 domain-containing protein n=1 Tax=Stentor coeruleus TaxID=5963 RepID=A0A1R2C490_9CILI|nr:hypothetical protein SteCoe_15186 [Stentor coeruleus]
MWKHNYRLIMYLAISNIITSVAFMIPYQSKPSVMCTAQGYLNNFGQLSSVLWTGCIMLSLYRLIVLERSENLKLELLYIVIAWIIPSGISFISINEYKPAGGWCWIKDKSGGKLLYIIGEFYGPYLAVLIYDIFVCYKIKKYLKKCKDELDLRSAKRAAFRRFVFYPITLIICYLPVIIHRFCIAFGITCMSDTFLNIFGIFGNCIYGFACAVIFGSTKYVRGKFTEMCCKAYIIDDSSLISSDGLILT